MYLQLRSLLIQKYHQFQNRSHPYYAYGLYIGFITGGILGPTLIILLHFFDPPSPFLGGFPPPTPFEELITLIGSAILGIGFYGVLLGLVFLPIGICMDIFSSARRIIQDRNINSGRKSDNATNRWKHRSHNARNFWSIGFHGLFHLYPKSFREQIGEDMYLNFVAAWHDRVVGKGYFVGRLLIALDLANIAWQGLVMRFERVKEYVIQS